MTEQETAPPGPRPIWDSINYTYRARLELGLRLPEKRSDKYAGTRPQRMVVAGAFCPQPYNHDTATLLARQFLQPLVDLGWVITSLIVTGSGDVDA